MTLSYEQLIAYIDGLYADMELSEQDYVDIINYIISNGDPLSDPRDLIQIRGGNEIDLPTLAQREMALTLDTEKLFIGGMTGNISLYLNNLQDVDITVTVGATGKFTSINDALDYLSVRRKKFNQTNFVGEVKLLSGFVVDEQVLIDSIDMSWVKITSEDSVVPINLSATSVQVNLPVYGDYSAVAITGVFTASNGGKAPIIDALFDMVTSVTGVTAPFCCVNGGEMIILKDKGCTNAKGSGVLAIQGGKIYAMGANLSNADAYAVACWRSSHVIFGGGDGSGCLNGAYIDVNSMFECSSANFDNSTNAGVFADNNSHVSGVKMSAINCGTNALALSYGTTCSARQSTLDGAGNYGVRVDGGSVVCVDESSIKDAGISGILATGASSVDAQDCDLRGAVTTTLQAGEGSLINAREALAQRVDGVDNNDIRVTTGSTIIAVLATGQVVGTNKDNVYNENGVVIGDASPEQTVVLSGGWSGTLNYKKLPNGLIHIYGNVTVGTATKNTIFGELITGYRPNYNVAFKGLVSGTQYGMHISTSGSMYLSEDTVAGTMNINTLIIGD